MNCTLVHNNCYGVFVHVYIVMIIVCYIVCPEEVKFVVYVAWECFQHGSAFSMSYSRGLTLRAQCILAAELITMIAKMHVCRASYIWWCPKR